MLVVVVPFGEPGGVPVVGVVVVRPFGGPGGVPVVVVPFGEPGGVVTIVLFCCWIVMFRWIRGAVFGATITGTGLGRCHRPPGLGERWGGGRLTM